MKSISISPARSSSRVSIKERAASWLKSENRFFSTLLEGKITNGGVIHFYHCTFAFVAMAVLAGASVVMAVLGLVWFASACILAKKGGEV